VKEIINELHNVEVDGKIIIDDKIREKMEEYMGMYCI